MLVLDYSQYYRWMECPWKWYETYINKVRPARGDALSDSALTLGSLVHNGLEHFHRNGTILIDDGCVKDERPTVDCLALAKHIINSYALALPNEPWKYSHIEEPVQVDADEGLRLLAKVDEYFITEEEQTIAVGDGSSITLEPGVWIREHKTKGATISLANFKARWVSDRQADFQCLCLQHKLGRPVNGILVNVLEKPRVYIPKRKCKGCKELLQFQAYTILSDGRYGCPLCKYEQELTPLKKAPLPAPKFYRVLVSRTTGQLGIAWHEIVEVGKSMRAMMLYSNLDPSGAAPNRTKCVDPWWGLCEFHPVHCGTVDGWPLISKEHPKFEVADTTAYMFKKAGH